MSLLLGILGLVKGIWSRLLRPLLGWLFGAWWRLPLLALAFIAARDHLAVKPQLRADRALAIAQRDGLKSTLLAERELVRQAALRAAAEDALNKARVEGEQARITEEIADDYQARLAEARAKYDRVAARLAPAAGRVRPEGDRASPGGGAGAAVPGLSVAGSGAAEAAGQDRLPATGELTLEDALIATEQALQLDALISWVERQAAVDVNGPRPEGGQ